LALFCDIPWERFSQTGVIYILLYTYLGVVDGIGVSIKGTFRRLVLSRRCEIRNASDVIKVCGGLKNIRLLTMTKEELNAVKIEFNEKWMAATPKIK
jgi:hypothetical protein